MTTALQMWFSMNSFSPTKVFVRQGMYACSYTDSAVAVSLLNTDIYELYWQPCLTRQESHFGSLLQSYNHIYQKNWPVIPVLFFFPPPGVNLFNKLLGDIYLKVWMAHSASCQQNGLGKQRQANFNGFIYPTVNNLGELLTMGLIFILAKNLVQALHSFSLLYVHKVQKYPLTNSKVQNLSLKTNTVLLLLYQNVTKH